MKTYKTRKRRLRLDRKPLRTIGPELYQLPKGLWKGATTIHIGGRAPTRGFARQIAPIMSAALLAIAKEIDDSNVVTEGWAQD